MIRNRLTSTAIVLCLIGLTSGCGKKEEAAPQVSAPTPPPAVDQAAIDAKKQEADKAAAALKASAEAEAAKVAADAKAAANQAAVDAKAAADKSANALQQAATKALQNTDKIKGLIDSAKGLIGENKYSEALKILTDLSSQNLAPDQQQMVSSLKQKAQDAMVAKAADSATKSASDAVGDLFKKK